MAGKDLKVALKITADLNQARTEMRGFSKDISSVSATAAEATTAQQRIEKATAGTTAALHKMSSATDMNASLSQLKAYDSQLHTVDSSLLKIDESTDKLKNTGESSFASLTKLAAAIGGVTAGIGLIDAVDTWGQYDVRIKMATESEAEYTLVKQRLLDTANNTFRPLQEAQELYIRTAKSVKDLGYNTNEVLDITDSFSYLLVTNAASADKAQSALDAYSKSVTKNKVEADAWESIVTAMPTIVTSIATASGMTEAQIRSLGTGGTIALKDLNEGLRKTVETNKALAATMDNTRIDALTALKNNMTNLLGEFNKTYQVTQTLSAGIVLLADNVELIGGAAAVAGVYALTKYLVLTSKATYDSVKATATKLVADGEAMILAEQRARSELAAATALQVKTAAELRAAQAAASVAVGSSAQAAAQLRLTAARAADTSATIAQTAAQEAYNTSAARGRLTSSALIGLMTGPVGLAALAASVAAGFLLMKDSSDESVSSIDSQGKSVAELRKEYEALDAAQQRTALRDQTKKINEEAEAYKFARIDLLNYLESLEQRGNISEATARQVMTLFRQFSTGKISVQDFGTELNKLTGIEEKYKSKIDEKINAVTKSKSVLDESNRVLDTYKGKTDAASSASGGLSGNLDTVSSSADGATSSLNNMTKAYKELLQNSQNNTFSLQYEIDQRKAGASPEEAAANAKTLSQLNAAPDATQTFFRVPDELAKANALEIQAQKALNDLNEVARKKEEEKTKELEKQKKIAESNKAILAASNEQTKNMLMVYQGFIKTGIPDSAARYLTAEVGREGDFLNKNIYGTHKDKNNGETNVGIISWQKTRAKNTIADLNAKGLLDNSGNIKQTQEAIDAQTARVVYELLNQKEYSPSKNALLSGDSYKNLQQKVGHNFIGWDIKANTLPKSAVEKNINRMDGYKNKLDSLLGADPTVMLAAVSKINGITADFTKAQEQQENNRISLRARSMTDTEKLYAEHNAVVKQLNEANFEPEELKRLLDLENQRYEDALSKRPEILKRVNDSVQSLNQDFLKQSGRGLEADLTAASQKYDQLKADIAALMMSEPNPAVQQQYQSMLVRIDYVIDKEQLTLKFNDAMTRLDELQSLRQQKQDTLKLQFESGQIPKDQYADGLKYIDAEMQPQLQTLAENARVLAENLGDAFSVEKVNNFLAGLNSADASFKQFLPTADSLNEKMAGGMTDAIMSWADGTESAERAFKNFASSFLREIAQMILKQMLFNAISQAGAGGAAGGGGGLGGMVSGLLGSVFSDGGYTGIGGKYDPAGIVHKGEVVWSQADIKAWGGVSVVEQMRKHRGYSEGGIVGAPNISVPQISAPALNNPMAQISNSASFNANQNFYLVDDPGRILDTLNSSQGQENLVVMMSRDPAKFRAALKLG
jgi:lambda family phage tail tape measure protein